MSDKLLNFIVGVTRLVEQAQLHEAQILEQASGLMRTLVASDDWLGPTMARSDPDRYQQHLLYGDPLDRFSVVSFVWGPGQQTPVHDHTVWGVIGVLRGSEGSQPFGRDESGRIHEVGEEKILGEGDIECVSPRIGDIHRVRNVHADRVSISIHLYGGNIGRIHRHVFMPDSGEVKPFVSGYSNALAPNLWTREPA